MNEDFLPDNLQEMARTQTTEEYQNNLNNHASFARDHIQWYINYIREILEEIPFPCSDTLDKKVKRRLLFLQKKRDKQLEDLKLSETIVKEDVNKLLNAMAGSVNYKWDGYNLGKIVGFQTDTISCSEDLIPLPIQSLYYISSLTYGYLIEHAIKAMILNQRVTLISHSIKKGKESEEDKQAIEKRLDDLEKKLLLHDDREMRHYESTNKQIDRLYKSTRRNKLTQKECAKIIYDARVAFGKKRMTFLESHKIPCIPNYCKYHVAKEESIEREIQRWDKMLNERRETKKCPPDGYSREKNASDFKNWINNIENDKYQIWEDNLITRLMLKEKTGLCQAYHEEDEENQENENDFQDRYESDLTRLTDHTTRRD